MSNRQPVFFSTMSENPQVRVNSVKRDFCVTNFPKRKRFNHQSLAQSNNNNKARQSQVASGSLEQQSPPKIWIIGASQICRAELVAHKKYGDNFGLDAQVLWFGKGGMGWSGVLPRFYQELSSQSPPDVLVLHAGGNDLGLVDATELVSQMDRDLRKLQREFPQMKMIFSCLHERQRWRYGPAPSINEDRKLVNRRMRKVLQCLRVDIIEHPNLRFFDGKVFVSDGVHFTQYGNAIFLYNIHQVIKNVLRDNSRLQQNHNQCQTSQSHGKRPRLYNQVQEVCPQQREAKRPHCHVQRYDKSQTQQQQHSCTQQKRCLDQEHYNQTQQRRAKRPRPRNLSNITDLRMVLSR